jgi:hypothetical protein
MRFKNSILKLFLLLFCSAFFYGIVFGEIDRQECNRAFLNLSNYDNILDLSGDLLYYIKEDVKKYLDLCKKVIKQANAITNFSYSYDYWENIENNIKQNTTLSVSIHPCKDMIEAIHKYDSETEYNHRLSVKRKETALYIKEYCQKEMI